MNTLKPRTKYKIESEEQLLEIQQAAGLQDYYWYVTDEINKVGILYVGDNGVCYDPPGVDSYPNHKLLEWKSPEIDFNNAYIDIENYSVDDIMRVSQKFSKVVGKPVEGYLETRGSSGRWVAVEAGVFRYMVVNNNEVKVSKSGMLGKTKIDEKDLDNALEKCSNAHSTETENKTTMYYPDFDFKIDLSGMTGAEKEAAKEWLCKVGEYRGFDCDVLYRKDDYNYFYLEDDMYKCVCFRDDASSELYHKDGVKELFLTFSEPEVEAFYTKDEEPSEKELQLQQLIDKLQSQLDESQKELVKIKN